MLDHIFYGVCNLNWWQYLLLFLIMSQVTIAAVTIYLHRYQAHRALELHPVVSHFFRLWLWLTTGMETKQWAAIHRKHHAKCETAEDPHSPQVMGIDLVLWQGAELYRKEAQNAHTLQRYGEGTPEDWVERNIYRKYSKQGIYLFLVLELILFGIPGLALWALQMAWIPFWAAGVVNGIGHFWGYRNFESPDQARNISPWGLWIGGEELHNNHHTFPTSAKFSVKWWEVDIGWGWIKLLSWLKLANVKRVPPKLVQNQSKNQIDKDTLAAVVTNRFQLMARYYTQVIKPTLKQELKSVGGRKDLALANMKKILIKDPNYLKPSIRDQLNLTLKSYKQLDKVYELKQSLQNIWSQSLAKEGQLIYALHKWCQEAENSGIQVLEEFSRYIRKLSLTPING